MTEHDPTQRAGTRVDAAVATVSSAGGSVRVVPPVGSGPSLVYAAGDVVAGRYRVERLLGRGGMGEVYEVRDQTLDQRVALKTLPRDRQDAGDSSTAT